MVTVSLVYSELNAVVFRRLLICCIKIDFTDQNPESCVTAKRCLTAPPPVRLRGQACLGLGHLRSMIDAIYSDCKWCLHTSSAAFNFKWSSHFGNPFYAFLSLRLESRNIETEEIIMLGALFFFFELQCDGRAPRKVQVLFIRLKKGEMFTYQKAKMQFVFKLHTKLSSNTRAIYLTHA